MLCIASTEIAVLTLCLFDMLLLLKNLLMLHDGSVVASDIPSTSVFHFRDAFCWVSTQWSCIHDLLDVIKCRS